MRTLRTGPLAERCRALDGMMGVYALRNTMSGRVYVGSSVNIGRRIRTHLASLTDGCRPVHEDIEAFGRDIFDVELLERVVDEDDLGEREGWWIQFLVSQGASVYNKILSTNPRYSRATRMEMKAKATEFWRHKKARKLAAALGVDPGDVREFVVRFEHPTTERHEP